MLSSSTTKQKASAPPFLAFVAQQTLRPDVSVGPLDQNTEVDPLAPILLSLRLAFVAANVVKSIMLRFSWMRDPSATT